MAIKPKNSNEFVHIGSIISKEKLPDILKKYRRESDVDLLQIFSLWNSIFEEVITKDVQPAKFKKKCLILHVTNSVWIHALQFQKQDMIQKINGALGKNLVEDIDFKVGKL